MAAPTRNLICFKNFHILLKLSSHKGRIPIKSYSAFSTLSQTSFGLHCNGIHSQIYSKNSEKFVKNLQTLTSTINNNNRHARVQSTYLVKGTAIRQYHVSNRNWAEPDNEEKTPFILSSWRPIIWPSVFKTIRNWFMAFLIKGYLDSTYTTATFLDGAEQAVNFVSHCLAEGQLEDLEDVVEEKALDEAKHYLSLLSISQKQKVAVNKDDVFLRYIHEIGMVFDDQSGRRFVEITTVFQGMPGFYELKTKGDPMRFQEQLKNNSEDLYICNYRFVREFTKGVEDDWRINRLNHFHPQEVVQATPPFQR